MDAYSDYILKLSNARVSELRREAAEYALSAAARRSRDSWWNRARARLRLPRHATPEVVVAPWGSTAGPEALERI
ncbi:MAG TPA: hypothetical protein VGV86_14620 [Acidimicrobiales bacterium]|nr:hypothetical protein [Acidimicrobiales bacterium]